MDVEPMTENKKTSEKNRLELLQDVVTCKAEQVRMYKDYNSLQLKYNELLTKINSVLIDQYNIVKDLNFAITALNYIAENDAYGLHDENTEAARSALLRLRTPSTENPLDGEDREVTT